MAMESGSLFNYEERHNAKKTKIGSLDLAEKDKFYYLFDFGDEWWHEVTVLKVNETTNKRGYPRVVKKVGSSPDQYPD